MATANQRKKKRQRREAGKSESGQPPLPTGEQRRVSKRVILGVLGLVCVAAVVATIVYSSRSGDSQRMGAKPRPGDIVLVAHTPLARQEPASQHSDLIDDNPESDGWDTEVFNQQAGQQLKALGKLIGDARHLDLEHVESLLAPDFRCQNLLPNSHLEEVFRDSQVTVRRLGEAYSTTEPVDAYEGAAGLVEALHVLVGPLSAASDTHVKFKLFNVEKNSDTITTRQYLSLNGPTSMGSLEQNATWICRWAETSDGKPKLKWIGLEAYERVEVQHPEQTLFSDCTMAVLGYDDAFHRQLSHDADHWAERISWAGVNAYQGLAIGDVNGDGREDVYVCQTQGLPNRLFVRNADGTVTDRAAAAGVDWLEGTRGALLVDLDNDGDQDLVVGSRKLLLMENDGQGVFTLRHEFEQAGNAFSLSSVDFDNDGNLDVYACIYYPRTQLPGLIPYPSPYHDANNGGRNILLRGQGEWRFTDVTKQAGLDANNTRFSLACTWEDYDNDGDQDLYVANDFGRNSLYRNDGGTFTDVAAQLGVQDTSFGMSAVWSDTNHDGWMDLYVSNMFSAAGNRVTYQGAFKPSESDDTREQMQYLARGNSLFENAGGQSFRDVSQNAAVMMGRWSWAAKFMDINNDGWEDLFVTNGYLTRQHTGDL